MHLSILLLTLRVALIATLINVPIAIAISWLLVKKKVRFGIILDTLVSLPLALPPVAIGFLLLLAFGREGPLGKIINLIVGVDIVFTWIAAVLALAVVSFPLVTRAIMVAMGNVDEQLEMSARSLGAGTWKVLLTITIPLAYRGILAGMLLGFVRALSEFGATITFAGNIAGKTQTLPLAIYHSVQLRDDSTALQLIIICIVIATITLVIHNRLLGKMKR